MDVFGQEWVPADGRRRMLNGFGKDVRQPRSEVARQIAEEFGILLLLISRQFVDAARIARRDDDQSRFVMLAGFDLKTC